MKKIASLFLMLIATVLFSNAVIAADKPIVQSAPMSIQQGAHKSLSLSKSNVGYYYYTITNLSSIPVFISVPDLNFSTTLNPMMMQPIYSYYYATYTEIYKYNRWGALLFHKDIYDNSNVDIVDYYNASMAQNASKLKATVGAIK